MQISFRGLPAGGGGGGDRADVDATLQGAESDTTIHDLIEAAGLGPAPELVDVDGRAHRCGDRLDAAALRQGSKIGVAPPAVRPLVRVTQIAGDGTGRAHGLPAGVHDVGRADPAAGDRLREPGFRITVDADGTVDLTVLDDRAVLLDDTTVACGDAVYRVDRLPKRTDRLQARPARGRTAFARSPRLVPPAPEVKLAGPEPPLPPKPPQPLSWVLLVAPIPFGLVMAYFFSPFFLAFTLMSPIMTVARWWDGKRQQRKGLARVEREVAERLEAFGREVAAAAATEAARRRALLPDLDQLRHASEAGSGRVWEVRADHADFLHPCVGLAPITWFPEVDNRALPGLSGALAEHGVLPTAPAPVALPLAGGIGVVGPASLSQRQAAALVAQIVARHGPADVDLAAVLGPDAIAAWDWLKWLPHLLDETGRARVARDAAELAAVLPELLTDHPVRRRSAERRPVRLLLIDDNDQVMTGLPDVSAAVAEGRAVAIVVADRAESLPSFCRSIVELTPTTDGAAAVGGARLLDLATAETVEGLIPLVADQLVVRDLARALARFADPEAPGTGGLLPDGCHLSELLAEPLTAAGVAAAWDRPPPGLVAALGVAETGPFTIDLVRDGPHALVAGTTGSGKSELLRTLIASLAFGYDPDAVNFVLVDFKGGGAFDACADLPHTVGVVTDLDEHLAERALRCLRAELTYRERFLRAAGVSDLRDLPAGPDGLPRLVIVVDEFATLAAELPTFMTSLVDVAQRGRSLGIHMVLATQRPSGVVDAKIRANTNLRIALRVQDDGDSNDVVGSGDAAAIHRDQAGRAFARLGADELQAFQTAIVSLPRPPQTDTGIRLVPFTLATDDTGGEIPSAPSPAPAPVPASSSESADGEPELRLLTAATRAEATARGLSSPRVPWPPGLPERIDLAELDALSDLDALADGAAAHDQEAWSAAIGLVDLPDEQRQSVLCWSARDDGNVLLFGVDPEATDQGLLALCTSLAAGHGPGALHLYAADFSGGLAPLDDLPQLGSRVGPQDEELVTRLLTLIGEELERRQTLQRERRLTRLGPADVPLFVLAVSNYAGLLEHLDERRDTEATARLSALIRDGGALGMVVFASGIGERGIPMRVAAQVPTKFVMRLADPLAYTAFGLRGTELPDLTGGRAIDARTKAEVQFAVPGGAKPCTDSTGPAARRLQSLATTIPFSQVQGHSSVDGDRWLLAIGVDHHDLQPAHLELRTGVHAVVAGPPGSGRSTALRAVAAACHDGVDDITAHTVNLDDLGRPVTDGRSLFELGGAPNLVLVDDVELLNPDLASALEQLAANPRSQARLVVAGRPEAFKGVHPLARALTVGRTGLLLQPQPDAGDVFRVRLRADGPQPEGRGFLLTGGRPTLAQIITPPIAVRREPMLGRTA